MHNISITQELVRNVDLLEMPHPKLLSQNLPFYKNIQVICMNIKVWEELAGNTSLYLPLTEIFFL